VGSARVMARNDVKAEINDGRHGLKARAACLKLEAILSRYNPLTTTNSPSNGQAMARPEQTTIPAPRRRRHMASYHVDQDGQCCDCCCSWPCTRSVHDQPLAPADAADRPNASDRDDGRRQTTVSTLGFPADQRPRERLLRLGSHALTDAELVAILLSTGTTDHTALTLAHQLLHKVGGVPGLTRCHPEQLVKVHGIGPAKVARVMAALALSTRNQPTNDVIVGTPEDLVPVLRPMLTGLRHERFAVAICDRRARVRTVRAIADGDSDSAPLPIRDTLATVLRHDGHAFAIAHNHPSGDPTPSPADRNATARIRVAASTAGLTFLCHLIICDGDQWSIV